MKLKTYFTAAAIWLYVLVPAQAQQLYKCGATFQDKPCDTEVQKKYSAVTGSFTKEQVTTGADLQCAEIGLSAVPVIQARLANETQDSVNAKIDAKPIGRLEKIKEKELVAAVFNKKGNATEIRGAIENDCMDKKMATKSKAQLANQTGSYADSPASWGSANASRAAAQAARAAADAARYSR